MPNHSIKMIKTSSSIWPLRLRIWLTFHIYHTWYFPYNHQEVSSYFFNESYAPIWLPTNQFLKVLTLAGFPQIIPQKVWHFRAWRKSIPEWFGVPAHGESRFPNGLELAVAKIWKVTVQHNGHVRLLGHYHSVPHTYVGKKESMRKRKTKESEKSLAM